METTSGQIVGRIQRIVITISNTQMGKNKSEVATITIIETTTVKSKGARETMAVVNETEHQ
jgi:hypothetical protein